MNLEVGSTLGDYQVIGILGAGGMGKVYKVRNVISERVEAMKVLLPDLATAPDLADRFIREIKVQASMEHPNIAALHTALRIDNQLVMLMELVEGVTLEQKLKDGPLPPAQAVDYIAQALSALEYAHAHGVVHRDIKPANMILAPRGVVKLLDFGIAKAATEQKLTMTGTTMGSIYYMSPEQIQGAKSLDSRSDLYSVGVSLYELVTGKHPFDGDSQYSIMASHLQSAPVPPITLDPRLPQDLNDIILLSVAKEPGDRFQTAAAFRNALGNILSVAKTATVPVAPPAPATTPVAAPAAPMPPPRPARGSKRGLWMGLGAVAAVAAILAFVQFGPKGSKAKTDAPHAATVEQPSPAAPPPSAAQTPPVVVQQQPTAQPTVIPPQKTLQQPAPSRPIQTTQQPPQSSPAVVSPRVQAAPAPVQQIPAASAPNHAELDQVGEQLTMLGSRAASVRSSLETMQRSQAAMGLNLRGDMQEASNLMNSFMDSANSALRAGNAVQAKSYLSKAEAQVERLEKFLGR